MKSRVRQKRTEIEMAKDALFVQGVNPVLVSKLIRAVHRAAKARGMSRVGSWPEAVPGKFIWICIDETNSNPPGGYCWWFTSRKDAREAIRHHEECGYARLSGPYRYQRST